jgi:protein phosphatase 1 regulatory subunit 7
MPNKKKDICTRCGKSFVQISRHKCKGNEKATRQKKKQPIVKFVRKWRSYRSIANVNKLKGLDSLQELNLEGNYIETIDALDHLVNLKKLNLSMNGISKISGLGKLIKLEVLKIASPQNYYEPPGMYGHADAWDRDYFDPIDKIEGLDKLLNLKELDLSRNNIKKIEGLENQPNLKVLDLSGNAIKKIEGLENKKKLEKLFIRGSRLTNLTGLKHLTNLRELSLTYNPIRVIDYKIAKHLPKLKKCDLPIHKFLKTVKINDLISVRLLDQDYSRYGQFNGKSWNFYPKFTTQQMSCLLAIIYVNGKMFERECPPGPERRIVKWGGLKVENENEFGNYCSKLKKWTKSNYKAGFFPKYMTNPLMKMLTK